MWPLITLNKRILLSVFFLFSLSPIIVDIIFNANDFWGSFLYLISRVSLFLLGYLLLNIVFNFRLAVYFVSLFVFIMLPVELVHLLIFKDFITRQGALALLQTNTSEGFAFLRGLEWLVLLLILCMVFFLFEFRKLPKKRVSVSKPGVWIAVVMLSFVTVLTMFGQAKIGEDTSGKSAIYYAKREVVKKYPINLIYRGYECYIYDKDIQKYKDQVSSFLFHSEQTKEIPEKQVYVLIIGESARAKNYELCGYSRNTNPNLSKLENLVVFSDYFSTANATTMAIPLMVTRATADDFSISLKEKSLVTLFKEAGFSTHWICNQEIFNGYGADRYLDEIENFYFTCGKGYDEVVLPVLQDILDNDSGEKQFVVINLFGNHYGMSSQPDEYNLFSPNLEETKVVSRSSENVELFINSYDNSVLYQDFVLFKIIQLVEAKDAVSFVFFSSDHGESLFDAPDFFYGHGSSKLTREQVHVPAFLWYSSLYKAYNEEAVSNLYSNRNKRLSADNLFYTVSNLGSISYPSYADSLSFADFNFIEPQTRVAIIDRLPVAVSFD